MNLAHAFPITSDFETNVLVRAHELFQQLTGAWVNRFWERDLTK